MYKILKVIPFGYEDGRGFYYTVFYCDSDSYEVFKKMDYYKDNIIVDDMKGLDVGDSIRIKKYYNLADLEDIYYEIYKEDN